MLQCSSQARNRLELPNEPDLVHGFERARAAGFEFDVTLSAVMAAAKSHVDLLDAAGTHLQLISPRPFQQTHSEKPHKLIHWLTRATNDVIAQNTPGAASTTCAR